jgi:bifunctional non-homologous end joining protein LigD
MRATASRASSRPVARRSTQAPKTAASFKFIEPCLATLRAQAPNGPEWLHEIKFDGYRTQAHRSGDKIRIYTRRGYDWTDRFGSIVHAISKLTVKDVVLDGEVIVPDARGASDFHALQNDVARK